MRSVTPALLKPARTLWNEIIGFLFFALAVMFAGGAVRHWRRDDQLGLFGLGAMALIMGFYAVSSFLRARKISRS